jgi:hypothetical protein
VSRYVGWMIMIVVFDKTVKVAFNYFYITMSIGPSACVALLKQSLRFDPM